jgi:two-component system NarL family response regulator
MQGIGPLQGLSVLVVEDAAYVRRALVNMLGRVGGAHMVGEAANGEEALELVGHDKEPAFQVVVCDLNMEGMTGLEVIAEVNKRFGDKRPAIVVVSSYTDDESAIKELKDLGVTITLGKPVLAGQLVEGVAKAAGRNVAA